jgi:tetratricopeptide (TPR) repeat protein
MSITEKKLALLELSQAAESPAAATPDTEALLLARLESSVTSEDYFRWLLFVVGFYRGTNKVNAATQLLNNFIESSKDPEHSAHCYLALGQIATDQQRHNLALEHFSAALEFAPKKRNVLYVLHNNMGFCFNSLGHFEQGERHCREAIAIDWTRASGFRNLGLSLNGQKNLKGAAWALAEAVNADRSDDRARVLLEKLLALHPLLGIECPWIRFTLDADPSSRQDSPLI